MLSRFRHVFRGPVAFFLLIASCSGGGCSGCGSCAGMTPLPGGFPADQAIENAASVRVSRPGLDFIGGRARRNHRQGRAGARWKADDSNPRSPFQSGKARPGGRQNRRDCVCRRAGPQRDPTEVHRPGGLRRVDLHNRRHQAECGGGERDHPAQEQYVGGLRGVLHSSSCYHRLDVLLVRGRSLTADRSPPAASSASFGASSSVIVTAGPCTGVSPPGPRAAWRGAGPPGRRPRRGPG